VSRPQLPTHLLVIDDDVSIRELLVEYLATRGYRVDGTSDGRIALELMRAGSYDLVLTDFQIPHRDGLDILRVARQMSPPLPTILMTGYGTVDTAVAALKEGAADFLLKPFRLKRVHEAIQHALERARQTKADARLMSTVALYDFAESVRDRWQLRLLYEQIATRAATDMDRAEAAVAVPGPHGEWELVSPMQSGEGPSLLTHIDLDALVDALADEDTLIEDEPGHLFPDLPLNAKAASWLAARTFTADRGPNVLRIAGVLLVAADLADTWANGSDMQPLIRLATLAGNVTTRVNLVDPSGAPDPTE